ncbi:epimerase [Brevibacillus thermoruber]|uniref:epimerase n=1 Tax=Brevibacillus thermoruber TaxID=33942 RepID=UPI0009E05ACD|nr:NAD-dependent epimerase/dehydratase family protein [Brevibacillus thermoruber]
MNKKVILAGGTGFLGQSLAAFLSQRGYEVVILTRGMSTERDHVRYVHWDGATMDTWTEEIDGSHAVINLAGKSVNCIYTKKNRDEIMRSRLDSVNVLTDAILTCKHPPRVFVQAGSLAIFGDTQNLCDEDAPHGTGFSVDVCKRWEAAFFSKELPSTRKVLLRIGFALGRDGGALEPLVKLVRYNLGGTVGSGNQYISWLHIDDLNEIFRPANRFFSQSPPTLGHSCSGSAVFLCAPANCAWWRFGHPLAALPPLAAPGRTPAAAWPIPLFPVTMEGMKGGGHRALVQSNDPCRTAGRDGTAAPRGRRKEAGR